MARRYGRAPRGERVVAAIPHGHWKTTTFIVALRQRYRVQLVSGHGATDVLGTGPI